MSCAQLVRRTQRRTTIDVPLAACLPCSISGSTRSRSLFTASPVTARRCNRFHLGGHRAIGWPRSCLIRSRGATPGGLRVDPVQRRPDPLPTGRPTARPADRARRSLKARCSLDPVRQCARRTSPAASARLRVRAGTERAAHSSAYTRAPAVCTRSRACVGVLGYRRAAVAWRSSHACPRARRASGKQAHT